MSHGHSVNISYAMDDIVLTVSGADGETVESETLYPVLSRALPDANFRNFIVGYKCQRYRMRVLIGSMVTEATQVREIAEGIAYALAKSGYTATLDGSFGRAFDYERTWKDRLGTARAHYERTDEPAPRDDKGWGAPQSAVLSELFGDILVTVTNSDGKPGEGAAMRPYFEALNATPGLADVPAGDLFEVSRDSILIKLDDDHRCCGDMESIADEFKSLMEFIGLEVTVDDSFERQRENHRKRDLFSLNFARVRLEGAAS